MVNGEKFVEPLVDVLRVSLDFSLNYGIIIIVNEKGTV